MIAAQKILITFLALCCAGIALLMPAFAAPPDQDTSAAPQETSKDQIGRASCRERV